MSDKRSTLSAVSKEDVVKNATRLPFPEENVLYHTEVAVQKNVLLIGKTGVGKSTLFEVIKNPEYKTPTAFSFFATGPKEPQYSPLVVRTNSGRAFSINVIDTPGIYEVRSSQKESRTNEVIVKSIQDCIASSVTHLSAILFLLPINSVLNEEDLHALSVMRALLGEQFKKNTFLVFTHADTHQLATLTERITEFLSSEVSLPFLDFCRGGIHFTGALNGELVAELGGSYESIVNHKVTCLRQNLLEAIIATDDVKVDFKVSEGKSHEAKAETGETEKKRDERKSEKSSKTKVQ